MSLEADSSSQSKSPSVKPAPEVCDVSDAVAPPQQSQLCLEDILESITDAFFSLDHQWRFTYLNRRIEPLLQRPIEHLLGQNIWDVFPDAVDSVFYREYHRVVAERQPTTFETYYAPSETWFEVRVYPLSGGLSVYLKDINNRKHLEAQRWQSEQQLRDSQIFLNSITNNLSDPLFVKDEQHRYIYFNDAFCELIGIARDDIRGKTDGDLFAPPEAAQYYASDQQVLIAETREEHEETVVKQNGERLLVATRKSCFRDAAGHKYLVCTIRDMTALKQQAEELQQVVTRLDLASRATNEGLWDIEVINGDISNPNNPIWWSPRFRELLGYTDQTDFPDQLESWSNSIHPGDRDWVLQAFDRHLNDPTGQTPYDVEYRMKTKQGVYRWFHDVGFTICDPQGLPIRIAGSIRDITARKRAEADAKHRQRLIKAILDNIPHRIWVKDRDGRHIAVNQRFAQALGLTPNDLLGKTDIDLWGAEKAQSFWQEDLRIMKTGQPWAQEEELLTAEGNRWFSTTKNPLYDEKGRVLGTIGISIDFTDRKRAEDRLRQTKEGLEVRVVERTAELKQSVDQLQQEVSDRQRAEHELQATQLFLESVLNALPVGIVAKEPVELRVMLWNPAAEAVLGISREQALGKNDYDLFPITQAERFTQNDRDVLNTVKTFDFPPREVQVANGETRIIHTRKLPIVDAENKPQYVMAIVEDVTERKQAEAALRRSEAQLRQRTLDLEGTLRELQQTQTQLIQSEKMSSLGQLVAGVAHEINNPVNFIYGNLAHASGYTHDLLSLLNSYQKHYPNPVSEVQAEAAAIDLEFLIEDMPKLLASMKVGAERIQKIVASLRNFSRMDEAEFKAVDIHDGLDSTLMILQNRLKAKPDCAGIEVVKEYGNLPLVECYAGQLNQVFMNIISNAIDALEEHYPVSFKPAEADAADAIAPTIWIRTHFVEPGQVAIHITDNGPGIPPALQQRLFDPFFTTKPVGKGTGLGMSISYQVVAERHGGSLTCRSTPGEGAEFTVQIPVQQTST